MRLNGFSFLMVCVALFCSCKKTVEAPPDISAKVKTLIQDQRNTPVHAVDTFSLTYDASGRLTSLVSTYTGWKVFYQYDLNAAYTKDVINGNDLVTHEKVFLNSDNLADSSLQDSGDIDSISNKFIYNQNRQLIRQRTYYFSLVTGSILIQTHDYLYDANGNMIKDTQRDGNDNLVFESTYTYSNQAAGSFSLNTIYQPAQNKNLVLTKSLFTASSGSTEQVEFSYTFDSNNRVVTETQQFGQGFSGVQKFIYY